MTHHVVVASSVRLRAADVYYTMFSDGSVQYVLHRERNRSAFHGD